MINHSIIPVTFVERILSSYEISDPMLAVKLSFSQGTQSELGEIDI